ncbi:MAG: nitronate monooxygenase [Pseudomonadota bacterium]
MARANKFAEDNGIRIPILMAPMAGACPASLSIAVANSGGMGACGVLTMDEDAIADWVGEMRAGSTGAFQLNTWIPDPAPVRNREHEAAVRAFLAHWGPAVPDDAADHPPPDFHAQCEAMLAASPKAISSIMGLYPPDFVDRMKQRNIKWYATVTTLAEAREAEAAGADVLIAQGMEAGGHRGAFSADQAGTAMIGLFSLLPAVVDAVDIPVIATGGIADARGVAAALLLGASAVQIGTGLLRTPEAKIAPAWADAIGAAAPEGTQATRAFSGRLGRSVRTAYVEAASAKDAPEPAPYPIQRALTQAMRTKAAKSNTIEGMQAWAGQSARLSRNIPAGEVVQALWQGAQEWLG